ncbi:MAG: DUF1810 domain-containing protein [Dysgonamonadaceae bacterium]|jgi:uncharacterized protein (DUF1810 family)|nr:DUF1810 domain-containing protein [Dysgonamonadaceae bacterium]
MNQNLDRFLKAQADDYAIALAEIKSGRKKSHWMWYIFPQIQGLGFSETSKFYAIKNIEEAKDYLKHPILGTRLMEIANELLLLEQTDAYKIFGCPDDLKLKSCMTLFSVIEESNDSIFKKVIDKFFNGNFDSKTIEILNNL